MKKAVNAVEDAPQEAEVEAPPAELVTERASTEGSETIRWVDLPLSPEIQRAIAEAGYVSPTPIQQQAIPLVLRGRDVMGLAQTGTGKTAAFTLPLVQRLIGGPRRTRALILTPTRELCVQVEESVTKYARHSPLDVVSVYGGVPIEPQTQALRAGVDVIVATPGRLIDHLERQNVIFDDLEILVLDEADRMLDMGFAPQISAIVKEIPAFRQTMLFSATMPPEVEALARKYLRKPLLVQVGRRSSAASTVTHAVYPVAHNRKSALLAELLNREEHESALVFTRTKSGADRVVRQLELAGIPATAMHADKTQPQRTKAIEDFKSGVIKVLVATDIAQRGLDIQNITHVVNYDVPQQPEDYVHRIGRTGRAAKEGDAYTFMAPDEIAMVRTIERVLGAPIPRVSVEGYDFGTAGADRESRAEGAAAAAPAGKTVITKKRRSIRG
ncbi:MAG: helicase [Gemmatimonadetes bacterium]|nr:helicase [Gemmatimonadota bacterium]